MPYSSLQDFIKLLDQRGELRRIKEPVSPVLEITEIADRVMKMPGGGPALLFENVTGYDMPVAINLFGSEKRMAWALGAERLDDLAAGIGELVTLPGNMPKSLGGLMALAPKLLPLASLAPRMVTKAPCQEVVLRGEAASLDALPILTCWPDDGGPYITLPLVFTKEPVTGKRNVGMYRIQKYDAHTTGMHWQRHKVGHRHYAEYEAQGRGIPVAIVLGGDPVVTYSATAPLPDEIDELIFAAYLRKKPIELVKCVSIDMEVPADAEIVIEGEVAPSERRREGPFGDHTGYYSLADDYPIFRVTAITRRKKAVYPTTIVGPPPMEDAYLGKATERLFLPLVKVVAPEIIDYNLPVEGAFHNMALVRIKKRYPGHAYKIMHALWGLGADDVHEGDRRGGRGRGRAEARRSALADSRQYRSAAGHHVCQRAGRCAGSRFHRRGVRLENGHRRDAQVAGRRIYPGVAAADRHVGRRQAQSGRYLEQIGHHAQEILSACRHLCAVSGGVDEINQRVQGIVTGSGDFHAVPEYRWLFLSAGEIDAPNNGVQRAQLAVDRDAYLKTRPDFVRRIQLGEQARRTDVADAPADCPNVLRYIRLNVNRRKVGFQIH